MDIGKWFCRAVFLFTGWYLMMTYPKDESPESMLKSLVIGSTGALVIMMISYHAGWQDRS